MNPAPESNQDRDEITPVDAGATSYKSSFISAGVDSPDLSEEPDSELEHIGPQPFTLPTPFRPSPRSKRRRVSRRQKIIVGFILLPVLLLTGSWFTVREFLQPEFLTKELRSTLSEKFAVGVSVDEVRFVFPNRIIARKIEIDSPTGSRFGQLVTIPRIYGELRWWPLLRGHVELLSLNIDGAAIYVERDNAGVCTLTQALSEDPAIASKSSSFVEEGKLQWSPPSITLRNLKVHTCPVSVFATEHPLRISELFLRYLDSTRTRFSLQGEAIDEAVAGIELQGEGNFSSGDFRGSLRIASFTLNDALRTRMTDTLRQIWDEYQPRGTADFSYELELQSGALVENAATFTLRGAGITMSDPPITLNGVSGQIEVTGDQVQIREPLTGEAFGGTATLDGSIKLTEQGPADAEILLKLRDIRLDESVRNALPAHLQNEWNMYSPTGSADLTLSARGDQFPPQLTRTHLDLKNVEATYRDYPYRIGGLSGRVILTNGEISVDVSGSEDPKLRLNARAFVEPNQPMHVSITLEDLKLDERVRAALPSGLLAIYDNYSPSGPADLEILLNRTEHENSPSVTVELTPRGASMTHEAFPLLVEKVTGTIRFSPEMTEFENLRGLHDGSEILLKHGEIVYGSNGHSDITIDAPMLKLGSRVIAALPEESADIAKSFGIQKNSSKHVSVVVGLHSNGDAPLEVEVMTQIVDPLQLRYDELPFPISFVSGTISYSSAESIVRIDDVRTSDSGPQIRVNGEHSRFDASNPDRRYLTLRLEIAESAEGIGFDLTNPEFVESLPSDLKQFSERMQFEGEVTGAFAVRHWTGSDTPDRVEYDGEIYLKDGSINFGMHLYDLNADFEVTGGYNEEQAHHFLGSMHRGSYRFSRFKIDVTQSTVFCYGEVHPRIPRSSESRETAAMSTGYLPTSYFTERLTEDRVEKVFQASIGPASLFGGQVDGFFFADLSEDGDFGGEAECKDVDLSLGGTDLFSTEDIAGLANGDLQVRGLTQEVNSMRGFGKARVRSARLSKIPALAALFLNPLAGMSSANLHFHKAEVERFEIEDRKIWVRELGQLKLESPVVNVHGQGYVSFDSEIDMILEPQTLGGFPVLSDLLNSIIRSRVKGSLDDPEVLGDTPSDP